MVIEVPISDVVFLQPVFQLLVAALVLLLLVVIFQKKKWINGVSLTFILVICCGVAALTLMATGIIADEYNAGGDTQSFFLCIAVGVLSLVNFLVYTSKEAKRKEVEENI
ncbi:hypothetical protein [Bacillus manliponensis]|uniref:hypothetical protein n=1 Tax=Bacillus manliponensis TaxID=574376 RepID=UPI0035123FB8